MNGHDDEGSRRAQQGGRRRVVRRAPDEPSSQCSCSWRLLLPILGLNAFAVFWGTDRLAPLVTMSQPAAGQVVSAAAEQRQAEILRRIEALEATVAGLSAASRQAADSSQAATSSQVKPQPRPRPQPRPEPRQAPKPPEPLLSTSTAPVPKAPAVPGALPSADFSATQVDNPAHAVVQVAALTDVQAKPRDGKAKLHLLSHRSCSQDQSASCNVGFIKEMHIMEKEGKAAPEIDEMHLYTKLPEELLADPRWATHIQPKVRGRGYWFWKASLTRLLISQGAIQLGDDLLYVDADSMPMMKHLIRLGKIHKNYDLIIPSQPHCEHVWTKGDIFARFGVTWDNPHYGLTQQPKAQAFLLRINERTLQLLKLWEGLLADFHLASDEPSRNKSLDGPWHKRKENRHDQSLLSMLIKASIPKSGSCNEPDFKCDRLGNDDETAGWQMHPEFGIKGLTVKYC
eukprot:TRINITY_DN75729_c0_g1_i1.p1 TRINITY_DN75729_c0_g1~~TRINITY_DN75729_c0_g1_i1.p1  ORF type:complete len:456 (-),score=76.85 TRINITY_DN75729_c0_g1_i1:2-1369(-)